MGSNRCGFNEFKMCQFNNGLAWKHVHEMCCYDLADTDAQEKLSSVVSYSQLSESRHEPMCQHWKLPIPIFCPKYLYRSVQPLTLITNTYFEACKNAKY